MFRTGWICEREANNRFGMLYYHVAWSETRGVVGYGKQLNIRDALWASQRLSHQGSVMLNVKRDAYSI